MKLFGIILCKNEENIIEQCVKFNRKNLDGLVVINNASSDRTSEILDDLLRDGYINEIINELEETYNQSKWITHISNYIRIKYRATHCISIDSDEFWIYDRIQLESYLKQHDVIKLPFYNFLPEKDKHFIEFKYRTTYKEYELENHSDYYSLFSPVNGSFINKFKAIYSLNNLKQVWQGNHDVSLFENDNEFNRCCMCMNDFKILHYPIQSYEKFKNKILQGYNAYKDIPDKMLGIHWRKLGELLLKDEELFKKEYNIICCNNKEHIDKNILISNNIIVEDSLKNYM